MTRTFIFFDVDGVLIQPRGYKEALRDSVHYFADGMGLGQHQVTDEDIAGFEALGVTNEWDTVPLCVTVLLNEALRHIHIPVNQNLPNRFEDVLASVKSFNLKIAPPDFVAIAQTALQENQELRPSHRFWQYFKQHTPQERHWLYDILFTDVYAITTPTTRVFQAHTLGYTGFRQAYQSEPPLHKESYLTTYDKPLLEESTRAALQTWLASDKHGASIFTARPSLPPRHSLGEALDYAPEADLAVELLNLQNLPIIASGRLAWLARQHNRLGSDYVKPGVLHALAALGAAYTGDELAGLEAAVAWWEEGRLLSPLADLQGEKVNMVVFEDSSTGVVSAHKACQNLQAHGFNIQVQVIGIAHEPVKRTKLAQLGAYLVDDINQGLRWLWQNS